MLLISPNILLILGGLVALFFIIVLSFVLMRINHKRKIRKAIREQEAIKAREREELRNMRKPIIGRVNQCKVDRDYTRAHNYKLVVSYKMGEEVMSKSFNLDESMFEAIMKRQIKYVPLYVVNGDAKFYNINEDFDKTMKIRLEA